MKKINVAIIGLGQRGYSLLKYCISKMDDLNIVAICDKYEDRLKRASEIFKKDSPKLFTDYKEILNIDNLDGVFIMTSWDMHIKMAIEFMQRKIYTAIEVGGAYSLEECYSLIDAYKKYKTPCMMLENCCYDNMELLVLECVNRGLFGKIVHCEGSYQHDIRDEIIFGKENRHYRLENYKNRNCDNYPTHEIGPIAKILKINNGNRFVSLYSLASNSEGLKEYIKNNDKADKSLLDTEFKQSDIITTLIKCEDGQSICICLDTTLPKLYSRKFTIRGTKGYYQEDGDIFYIDKNNEPNHKKQKQYYNSGKKALLKYKHPIVRTSGKNILHGKMDWRVIRAFIESIKRKENTPIDVYDIATWAAISVLSDISIKQNKEVEFPDFTNGEYKNKKEKLTNPYSLD